MGKKKIIKKGVSDIKIGIIDADLLDNGTRHPNLALMKISGYYKNKGYCVELLHNYNNIGDYDKIYLSKVFTFTNMPINIDEYNHIKSGGTGLYWDKSPKLPYEIEHHMPDYKLYDKWIEKEINRGIKRSYFLDYLNYSIGFATKGCVRQCKFCINENVKGVRKHSPIGEFLKEDRRYIYLWDDNFLAYPKWSEVLDELESTGKRFQFRQGLDIRFLTEEKAKRLANTKYKGDFIFAFDNIEDRDLIIEKIKIWKKHYKKKANVKFYVLCGYDRNNKYDDQFWKQDIIDTFERIKILMKYKSLPYIMRYEKYQQSPFRGMYINLARWCNQPSFFKKKTFREFCYANQNPNSDKDCASVRYMKYFEGQHSCITKEYFDMRFEDF